MLVTDTVPEGFEKFELSNGKTYCGRANSCFFCSHLTDIFLDWNGPYALVCDCRDDTSKGISGDCPFFKKHSRHAEEADKASKKMGRALMEIEVEQKACEDFQQ